VLGAARTTADFAVRLAFFALAPQVIVVAAALFPVTSALVTIGLALGVFVGGEALRGLLTRWSLLGRLLRGLFAFESYYREHPPRPFLYYVFYPLLLPYWLWVRSARAEFWLYRGYTLGTAAILLGGASWQYFSRWRPELGVVSFLRILAMQLVVETLFVSMALMPLATTVVHFHAKRARVRLGVLLLVALGSSGFALYRLERRRDPIVSFETRERLTMRTAANPEASHQAMLAALRAAWKVLPQGRDDVEEDGKVQGEVLAAAHEALGRFYRPDEAFAFDLWLSLTKRHKLLVVYFEARRGKPPIFLALDRRGRETSEPDEMPEGALAAMKQATRGPARPASVP
jgi:hypothetical protein